MPSSSTKAIRGGAFKFFGVSDTDSYFQAINDGFENYFELFCAHHLRKGDIVLDVGANIGVTAAIMSTHIEGGHIHAFEPANTAYDLLKRNLEINALKNVTAHNLAVQDHAGLVRVLDYSAYGHITSDQNAQQVRATTIDEIVSELALPRVDFIKIDVEGWEKPVLLGAMDTIKRFRPLIHLEFNSWCLTAFGKTNPLEFAEWLLDCFSNVLVVDRTAGGELLRLQKSDALMFTHDNMVRHSCIDDLVVTNDDSRLQRP